MLDTYIAMLKGDVHMKKAHFEWTLFQKNGTERFSSIESR